MRLAGKTALVSGASRNIGRTIALTFAREGADVILVSSKSSDELREVARECEALGVCALPLQADVSKHEEVSRMVQQGLERFGKIDTLVSVAAIRPHKPLLEISPEDWHHVMAVNLDANFYLAKAVAPGMMERKSGNIVALGGMSSVKALPIRAHVATSKTGLHGLIKSLAHELGPHGIRANLLVLANIETKRLNPEWYPDSGGNPTNSERLATIPLRRSGTPQEVANVALFLASDDSSFVTGDRIICAGGEYM